jgi:AcrR family transcriptional regulator
VTARSNGRRAAKGRRTRSAPDTDHATRQLVIDAAIATILEQGFYRASSNAIAERAGITWGVIQYHFGSREALMLAVLEEGTRRLVEDLATAEITAPDVTGRIEQYTEILERYYGDPTYLAFLQVLLNFSHDPRTSRQTRNTMTSITRSVTAEIARLTDRLFDGLDIQTEKLRPLVFHVLRGWALSEVLQSSVTYAPAPSDTVSNRHLLAEALTMLIEREAGTPRRRRAKTG